jgi:divalent metal cation (Fe/Co/Zn/Cd) transporter
MLPRWHEVYKKQNHFIFSTSWALEIQTSWFNFFDLFMLNTCKKIKNYALIADSKETLVCSFLSVALLLGLGLNYFIGFWYADLLVGLMIVVFLLKEGWQGWQEINEEKGD